MTIMIVILCMAVVAAFVVTLAVKSAEEPPVGSRPIHVPLEYARRPVVSIVSNAPDVSDAEFDEIMDNLAEDSRKVSHYMADRVGKR